MSLTSILFGKQGKLPKAPDYAALANQQAAQAKQDWQDSVVASRPNQVGPMGSRTWTTDASGRPAETVSMTPDRQGIYDTLNKNAGAFVGGMNTGQVNLSGAPGMPTVGGYNQQAIDTIRALQAPQLEQQRAAKEAQLAAMGLGTGSGSAWNTEQQNIGDRENRAGMEAILAGINQGNTEFGQGMALHTTGTGDILNQNAANLQKMQGLTGAANQFQMPQFSNAPTPGMPGTVTPNLLGAASQQYQAGVNRANSQTTNGLIPAMLPTLAKAGMNYLTGGASGAASGAFDSYDYGPVRKKTNGFDW